MSNLLQQISKEVNYDPAHLLDFLRQHLKLRNDKALADKLDISASAMSKLRNQVLPIGSTVLIRMHEISEISIKELRVLMGDHRPHFKS